VTKVNLIKYVGGTVKRWEVTKVNSIKYVGEKVTPLGSDKGKFN
jgi:hypothetical protein